jgi:MFS family permease
MGQAVQHGRPLWPFVSALGVSQIIGYGTLYYAFASVTPHVGRDLQISQELLFAWLSAGFLAGGMLSPFAGRLMDHWGAARLMTVASAGNAIMLAIAAWSDSSAIFAVATIAMQVISVGTAYDAAFATISQVAGSRAQRAITWLTFIAGLSSTLFWPLTGWLLEHYGWRGTYFIFGAMHAFIVTPLHGLLWRLAGDPPRHIHKSANTAGAVEVIAHGQRSFWLVATSFAMSSALITALGTHLVPLLIAKDLGASAYVVSMLMGPAQVLIRITNATLWRNLQPLTAALVAALALPVSAALLLWPSGSVMAAALFSIVFGVGQGLFSITRGTVPLQLFGPQGYGATLGKLASVRTVLSAAGPFALALVWHRLGIDAALALGVVVGLVAAVPLAMLRRM